MIEFEGLPESLPELVDPVMLCAFEGWNDAGDAASGAVLHLEEVWSATQIAEMDPEDYYDFQVNRPEVTIDDGVRSITWPTTRISVARIPLATRDVVLVSGIEPSMRWRTFTQELLDVARELGVEMVVTLGALLADSPHTRPVPVSGTSSDSDISLRMGYEPSTYEGPTGIVGVLHAACAAQGIPSASLWAAVPTYLPNAPSPKAALALVRKAEVLLHVEVPAGDLESASRAYERQVDEAVAGDEETAAYVARLEESFDEEASDLGSGDDLIEEVERFLRDQS